MISTAVPPNGKFCFVPTMLMNRFGRTATMPRYREPGRVIRLRMKSRYSAVGLPGRIPGTKPPYLRMLSETSVGLNVIET